LIDRAALKRLARQTHHILIRLLSNATTLQASGSADSGNLTSALTSLEDGLLSSLATANRSTTCCHLTNRRRAPADATRQHEGGDLLNRHREEQAGVRRQGGERGTRFAN
jgi:hypothetical protein